MGVGGSQRGHRPLRRLPRVLSVCGLQSDLGSYENLGEGVGAGAADVALGGVERHVVDRLLELLAVGGELLDARFTLHVPQADGAVVTCTDRNSPSGSRHGQTGPVSAPFLLIRTSRHEVQSVWIHSQTGHRVQVGDHGVDQFTCRFTHSYFSVTSHSVIRVEPEPRSWISTCVVIEELDVPVLLSCDGDWQRGMTQNFVDLAGSFCAEADGTKDNVSI